MCWVCERGQGTKQTNIPAVWSLYPWGRDMQMTVSKNIIYNEVVYSTDICSQENRKVDHSKEFERARGWGGTEADSSGERGRSKLNYEGKS